MDAAVRGEPLGERKTLKLSLQDKPGLKGKERLRGKGRGSPCAGTRSEGASLQSAKAQGLCVCACTCTCVCRSVYVYVCLRVL